ncbi:hypothetical protein LCGC14_1386040 [marine sediment metagenome]|uniref:Uncharacterized protein n=1 Tax=marine sediment metagenome TaxID=412755 RepID=A0A0F9MGS3_9ZZZZ
MSGNRIDGIRLLERERDRYKAQSERRGEALEGIAAAVTVNPDPSHLSVIDIGAFWDAWPLARATIEEED